MRTQNFHRNGKTILFQIRMQDLRGGAYHERLVLVLIGKYPDDQIKQMGFNDRVELVNILLKVKTDHKLTDGQYHAFLKLAETSIRDHSRFNYVKKDYLTSALSQFAQQCGNSSSDSLDNLYRIAHENYGHLSTPDLYNRIKDIAGTGMQHDRISEFRMLILEYASRIMPGIENNSDKLRLLALNMNGVINSVMLSFIRGGEEAQEAIIAAQDLFFSGQSIMEGFITKVASIHIDDLRNNMIVNPEVGCRTLLSGIRDAMIESALKIDTPENRGFLDKVLSREPYKTMYGSGYAQFLELIQKYPEKKYPGIRAYIVDAWLGSNKADFSQIAEIPFPKDLDFSEFIEELATLTTSSTAGRTAAEEQNPSSPVVGLHSAEAAKNYGLAKREIETLRELRPELELEPLNNAFAKADTVYQPARTQQSIMSGYRPGTVSGAGMPNTKIVQVRNAMERNNIEAAQKLLESAKQELANLNEEITNMNEADANDETLEEKLAASLENSSAALKNIITTLEKTLETVSIITDAEAQKPALKIPGGALEALLGKLDILNTLTVRAGVVFENDNPAEAQTTIREMRASELQRLSNQALALSQSLQVTKELTIASIFTELVFLPTVAAGKLVNIKDIYTAIQQAKTEVQKIILEMYIEKQQAQLQEFNNQLEQLSMLPSLLIVLGLKSLGEIIALEKERGSPDGHIAADAYSRTAELQKELDSYNLPGMWTVFDMDSKLQIKKITQLI
ncbi:MAG: hypothetical protein LBD99_00715, partial [Candidatus Margulisbacteria bacterium]|nr:hypothetical protein [Candidatus Margulisiibacteriota bacterium]